MPAMSLICGEFIKSLLTPAETSLRYSEFSTAALSNGKVNGIGNGLQDNGQNEEEENEEDDDYEEEQQQQAGASSREQPVSTLEVRKTLLEQNTALERHSQTADEQRSLDARLQRVAKLQVHLNFGN